MRKSLITALCMLEGCGAVITSGTKLFIGGKSPVVTTRYGQFQGRGDILTRTSNYLGIPYASAPRFDHSIVASTPFSEIFDASEYGASCPQHEFTSILAPSDLDIGSLAGYVEAAFSPILSQSEECLFINIQRPLNISSDAKLPVLLWIHGGGFEAGAGMAFAGETSAVPGVFYQGANLVKRSQDMGRPIIVASINYRLMSFGFSASQEMADAGLLNLGLEDQRNAMKWIKQNIDAFGGDSDKVTIMGESAGSWSVTAHLVANDGDNEGLFRGAVGISGGPLKVAGPERSQALFDDMVKFVGCATAPDKIACLRLAPYEKIAQHAGTVDFLLGYRSLASAWTLRPDGRFLKESPDKLVAQGKIADVPLLYGNMKDEGTLFSLVNSLNTTTTEEVINYFGTYWWPNATEEQLEMLMELYPTSDDSPGLSLGIGPQFKRICDLTGDYSFQSQRRQLLDKATAPKWNYLIEQSIPLPNASDIPLVSAFLNNSGLTEIPILGSFHASDVILNWFGTLPGTVSKTSYHLMGTLIAFVNDLNPNDHGMANVPDWPQYDDEQKSTMHWQETGVEIIADDYRQEAMAYLNEIGDSLRI